jgi:hypothetical protein
MRRVLLPPACLACAACLLAWAGVARSGGDGGTVVKLGALKSRAPVSWKHEKAANKFRAYQFLVPRAEGDKADAQLIIFHFGAGSGGAAADNVQRWKGMFRPPEGKTIEDVSKVKEMKVSGVPVTYLDVQGTYLEKFPPFDPNAKITRRPNYRRLGVVFDNEGGPYFITLTGPARTVGQHQKEFDNWLKAFK